MKKYKLELTHQAESVLRRMAEREVAVYKRVAHVLDILGEDPFQGKLLKGSLKGFHSYRVGCYRVIYRIFQFRLLVIVIDIGHRRDIYR
ncbi:MAG: type II toxin-antitoxin system mRNA interferase toxin, RelE/StbE family [Candidatus Omnitrophica bacterium]|nr:type II toxin-antitoxin system mRNA interferase toxin, RelE/StbE family [Candidatus Omnitrophota bacterium]